MSQHIGGAPERKVAIRWCVGCIPEPVGADKEARGLAVEALSTCARSLEAARLAFEEAHEGFLESERVRALMLKFAARWRRRVALGGPTPWWRKTDTKISAHTSLPRGPSELIRMPARRPQISCQGCSICLHAQLLGAHGLPAAPPDLPLRSVYGPRPRHLALVLGAVLCRRAVYAVTTLNPRARYQSIALVFPMSTSS